VLKSISRVLKSYLKTNSLALPTCSMVCGLSDNEARPGHTLYTALLRVYQYAVVLGNDSVERDGFNGFFLAKAGLLLTCPNTLCRCIVSIASSLFFVAGALT